MAMTNMEKWFYYNDDSCSPDTFIESCFLWMMSACLQRRVWVGPEHEPLYAGIYMILCADPGVGKGMAIKPAVKFLAHHNKKEVATENKDNVEDVTDLLELTREEKKKNIKESAEKLFPKGAEDTTYQAMLKSISNALGVVRLPKGETPWYAKTGKYVHHSMYVALEELSSLFKKDSSLVCKFLLVAYDAGNYDYDTIGRGTETIRKVCLHLIGGTTPSYMQETFEDKLLTDGFASRTFFIYEFANRKKIFGRGVLNEQQKQCAVDILKHMKDLSTLCGAATFNPEGYELMRSYFEHKTSEQERTNKNFKLEGYYSRWNIHVQKIALAIHFSESLDMVVSYSACERAIKYLEKIERNMHHALQIGNNRLAQAAGRIVKFLRSVNTAVSKKSVYINFVHELRGIEFDEVMKYLIEVSGLVETYGQVDNSGNCVEMVRLKQPKA